MGIIVTDYIRPVSTQDTYPTHLDIYGKGGIHGVNTIVERNNIAKPRRKEGMLSFVKEDNSFYALLGGTENINWVKIAYFSDGVFYFNIPLKHGYILIGDKDNLARQSPLLIDVRQDIVDLRRKISNFEELNKLDYNRIWIGNYYNEPEERLNIGIINLPQLVEAVFPTPIGPVVGDLRIPNPTFDYLSAFDWVMSGPFLPQTFATKYDSFGNPVGTDASSSLAMTQVRAAQIMKRFDNANFIVGSSTVDFTWENPKMYLIPETIRQLYGLGTTYTFTKAQSLGDLETGLLKNTVSEGKGTLSKAISGEDYVNTDNIPIGKLVVIDPLYPMHGRKLISPTDFSTRGNNPGEFGNLVANVITVLIGLAGKFNQFAVTSLTDGKLVKSVTNGELKSATPGVDYVEPSVIDTIMSIISAFQTAYNLFVAATTAKDIAQDTAIAANTAKDLVQDVEIITAQTTATGAATVATAAGATAAAAEVTATGAATTAAGASAAAAAAGIAILALQVEMLTKASMGDVTSSVNSAINALTLNGINVTNNIDIKGFKVENLGTPSQPSDAATKAYVDFAVAGIPAPLLTLIGDISGFGYIGFPITTIFNKTLNQIPNAGDVNIAGFNLKNLNKTPEDYDDATSFDFLCNLLQDEVGVQWL